MQEILRFLDTTSLRDQELLDAFRDKLREAKLFPKAGSIEHCEKAKQRDKKEMDEIVDYVVTREA